MRRALIAAVAVTALLASSAPALAQDDPSEAADVGQLTADPQGTHFSAPVTCATPAPGTTACPLTLPLYWQLTPRTAGRPSGEKHVVSTQSLVVPVGAPQTVTIDVAPK